MDITKEEVKKLSEKLTEIGEVIMHAELAKDTGKSDAITKILVALLDMQKVLAEIVLRDLETR